MIVTIQPLNPQIEDFDTFYANALQFLDLSNDPTAEYLVQDHVRMMYDQGVPFDEVRKTLSAYREKVQLTYRGLLDLKELQLVAGEPHA